MIDVHVGSFSALIDAHVGGPSVFTVSAYTFLSSIYNFLMHWCTHIRRALFCSYGMLVEVDTYWVTLL